MNSISAVLDQRKEYYLNKLNEGARQRRAAEFPAASSNVHSLEAPTRATPKGKVGKGTTARQRNVALTVQTTPAAKSAGAPRVSPATSSIESGVVANNTSIEIPPEIDVLIDNKAYYNKFSLIRKGHLQDLLDLASEAATKDRPSHWFARSTRTTPVPGQENHPTYWERSLKYLAKLRNLRRMAELVAAKIGTDVTKGILRQIWRKANVQRWADIAAETKQLAGQKAGKRTIRKDTDPAKYFMWLCGRELAAKEGNSL